MAEIVVTRRAVKDLDKLEHDVRIQILKRLQEYALDPMQYAVKLTDPKIGTYRFRIGPYRAVFDLTDGKLVILRIGHRREIYR